MPDASDRRIGSRDWAYSPFILATAAAALGLAVRKLYTFYSRMLLNKKHGVKISAPGNPAMEMPMFSMPNPVSATSGVATFATMTMKNLIEKKGVASTEELRSMAPIEGPAFGGDAIYNATEGDINLFI